MRLLTNYLGMVLLMGLRRMYTYFSFSVGSASIRDPKAPRTIPSFSLSLQSNVPADISKRKYSSRQRQGHVFSLFSACHHNLCLDVKGRKKGEKGKELISLNPFY